jgi:hypothetical protein
METVQALRPSSNGYMDQGSCHKPHFILGYPRGPPSFSMKNRRTSSR